MTPRRQDSGFAMLFVLLMAGLIAITLYLSLPRAAFEAQREKEQTLIDRGSQYKRAIQLYVRQNKRWPAKVEDLESTNGKRYLRRRYVDPMTGKDEWRPVHVGPNGILTDSLIKPLKKDGKDSTYSNTFITELGGVSATPEGTANPGGNPGLRKRPSDLIPGGDPTQLGGTQTVAGATTPGGIPGGLPGSNGQTGQPNLPGGVLAGSGLPQQLRGNFPGNGTGAIYPGPPVNSQTGGGISVLGGVGGGSYSTNPGANGPQPPGGLQGALQGQLTGLQPGQPGAANGTPPTAAQLIGGLLTTPRPGGAPGTPIGSGAGAGQVQGGGIAGFASKFEGDAIKVYNDQTEYQKWEFVYDLSKDVAITGGQRAIPQPPGPNTPGGFNSPNQTGTGSAFGNQGTGTTNPAGTVTPATGHQD
jgi:type II secretory pathway pseudopilin PulG